MAFAQSFTESGSDKVRDGIVDACSYCATKGKLQPAIHFCFDCGVNGRYICGECLQNHNMFVNNHVAEVIAFLSSSRRKQLQTDLAEERQKSESLAKKLREALQELDIHKTSFQRKFVKMEEIHEKLKGKNENLLAEIKELKATQNETLNSLSKVAGAKLTDNNPNIADLSDPNWPTRLAEQYSDLYDNPWTDTFDSLKLDEKDCIKFLLNILVDCYTICGDVSLNHQKILKRVLSNPTEGTGSDHKKMKEAKESPSTLSAVQSKALSELRKQSADLSVVSVRASINKEHQEWFKTKPLEKYTFHCIELCWLMHVQSPPVCLKTSVKAGSPFDTSRYKLYTKAGKKIDYLVWPALLLHEGGAMLGKGVAQGK